MKHIIHGLLWTAESKTQLLENMDRICETWPELKSFVKNKKVPWIMSGLCKGESKIPPQWWDFARKHTGISESSHFQDNNFTGRKTSLVNAILK
jgi:hypothetical protein